MTFIILIIESLALQYCSLLPLLGIFPLPCLLPRPSFCLVSVIYPHYLCSVFVLHPLLGPRHRCYCVLLHFYQVYATEAIWILRWPQTGDFTGYIGSLPFLLKMLETLVACVILPFISTLPVHGPSIAGVVRGCVLHLLHPGDRDHPVEPG